MNKKNPHGPKDLHSLGRKFTKIEGRLVWASVAEGTYNKGSNAAKKQEALVVKPKIRPKKGSRWKPTKAAEI